MSTVTTSNIREHKAAYFVARLYSGQMTDADEQALNDWLALDAQNQAEYQAALTAWDRVGDLSDRLHEPGVRPAPAQRGFKLAVAASIILLITAVAVVTQIPKPITPQPAAITPYATTTGEQKTITLDDGTTAILNTNTRLLVDYGQNKRRAILEYGEVFFDVKADPERPFVIDTGFRSVTVLGTRFDVFKSGIDLKVSVVEGAVAVHRSEDSILHETPALELLSEEKVIKGNQADQYRLGAGVSAQFSGVLGTASAIVKTQPIKGLDKYPYWRTGQIRFDEQPLYEVIKELNRYSQTKVLIEDNRIMDMSVSGVFSLKKIDAALDSFEVALPLRVTRYPDRIVIVGSGQ